MAYCYRFGYAEKVIYDEHCRYYDAKCKMARQWYGLLWAFEKVERKSGEATLNFRDDILFELRTEYKFKRMEVSGVVCSLVGSRLDGEARRIISLGGRDLPSS
ncbi:hypothetical protein HOY82DRAFT_559207 [Tuber indicum]|nr:hypothetical protein HOY82DRAFT_559207 [Tuber indicum]